MGAIDDLIEPDDWKPWQQLSMLAVAALLKAIAARIDLRMIRKHERGPKRPVPERTRFKNEPHVSTKKLLDGTAKEKPKRASSRAGLDRESPLINVGDVNGDRRVDLVTFDSARSRPLLFRGTATGFDETPATIPSANAFNMGPTAAHDVNRDGFGDLLLNNSLYLGSAAGLSASGTVIPPWRPVTATNDLRLYGVGERRRHDRLHPALRRGRGA